ncbi:Scr1 family TA system antitoxin-like transcriptional regulator [Streptomyces albidoflavus]
MRRSRREAPATGFRAAPSPWPGRGRGRLRYGIPPLEPAAGTGESLARQGDAVLKPAILGSFPQFVVQEGRAVEIWLFELGAMQGLFQSQTYAAAIVEGLDSGGGDHRETARRTAGSADRTSAVTGAHDATANQRSYGRKLYQAAGGRPRGHG